MNFFIACFTLFYTTKQKISPIKKKRAKDWVEENLTPVSEKEYKVKKMEIWSEEEESTSKQESISFGGGSKLQWVNSCLHITF